jgi:hypothetical protein
MQKQALLLAVSILILVHICAAQSGISENKNTNKEAARRKRRIKQLIEERDKLKMFLTEYERIRNLPDIEKKREEYEKKLEQLRKMEVVAIPTAVSEKYGDDWRRLYLQIRGIVSGMVVVEALNSEIEPFVWMFFAGTLEKREQVSRQFGIYTPYTEAEKFWDECKDVLVMKMRGEQRRLWQLRAKYDIPDVVIRHAEEDSKKEYYKYAYKYLIALFSKEKVQESKQQLERIESELSKYPDWKDIEQELLQSYSPDVNGSEAAAVVDKVKRIGLGQVIEKTVYHNAPERGSCLDVETAGVLKPPSDGNKLDFRWFRANGIDFGGMALPDFRSLHCIDSQMVPAANELWDIATVDLLKENLKATSYESPLFIETERRLIKDELPVTYVFHTREGSIGILQILKVEVRGAINVRYKILAFGVETEEVKVEGN